MINGWLHLVSNSKRVLNYRKSWCDKVDHGWTIHEIHELLNVLYCLKTKGDGWPCFKCDILLLGIIHILKYFLKSPANWFLHLQEFDNPIRCLSSQNKIFLKSFFYKIMKCLLLLYLFHHRETLQYLLFSSKRCSHSRQALLPHHPWDCFYLAARWNRRF